MPSKPPRQSTETRQAEIVSTLLRLAAGRSAAEITTTDIAKAMHLTQGALFKHFPSKEAIRLAVMDWIEEALMQRLLEARQQAATPVAALRAMFMAHVAFVIEHPGAPRLVFGELQQPDDSPVKQRVCQLMQRYRAMLSAILEEATAARLIRPDIDRPAAAALFLGAIQGLVIQSMVAGTVQQLKAQAPAVFNLYLNGLEATP
ncbi:transcriptional regulator, TetR family [Formivibrio citricus]|uniref:Transcriptional regulator, TetR family n=1 Tax=Formivibrio citricus TaxID=83765 RepID=A0A1I5CL73_9NEIS|nr:TetR/AcrR family transcriptional regulator [Formivibrio citricus]SFN87663.1 transcriptional regulator, TetR family [Formivibrio citricus]